MTGVSNYIRHACGDGDINDADSEVGTKIHAPKPEEERSEMGD